MLNKMVSHKIIRMITVLLVVLFNITALTGAGLMLNTRPVSAGSYVFDAQTAINYAETWWNSRNPAYHDYGNVDCANFVSQCLIAGGLNLSKSPYGDSWGCIPSCDNLHTYLVNYLGVRYETKPKTEPVPSWFGPGDVAMFGDSRDPWQHSVFAVGIDSEGNTVCDAHSNNRHLVTIGFYVDSSSTWTLCSYYNISEADNLIPTTIMLSDAVAAKGKPVNAQAVITAEGGNLSGVTIKILTQQKVKNVAYWVYVGSAVSDSTGRVTVSIPAKSITMSPQPIKAVFAGDDSYGGSAGTAMIYRQ